MIRELGTLIATSPDESVRVPIRCWKAGSDWVWQLGYGPYLHNRTLKGLKQRIAAHIESKPSYIRKSFDLDIEWSSSR